MRLTQEDMEAVRRPPSCSAPRRRVLGSREPTMTTVDRNAIRIIDANLNRAREALRVMEEYARLGMGDVGLSTAIKETRHSLAEAVPERLSEELIPARDITGDVGCDVSVPAEYERPDSKSVALIAGKRLGEALRTIEEYGKTVDPAFAARVEKIRYRGYEIERRLGLTVRAQDRFGRVRLYVVLTEALCRGDWFATAQAALQGGADCLQLREKAVSDRVLLERARRLAELCHEHDALFIVNDRPDVAAISGADGVHLGQSDMPVADARRILPPSCVVGISTHTPAQVVAAAAEVPDYIAVGSMFATTTKPRAQVAGPQTLAAARGHTSLPLVSIGGIDVSNVRDVLSAATCAVGVCRAVIAQPDVVDAASRLRALVDRAFRESPPRR